MRKNGQFHLLFNESHLFPRDIKFSAKEYFNKICVHFGLRISFYVVTICGVNAKDVFNKIHISQSISFFLPVVVTVPPTQRIVILLYVILLDNTSTTSSIITILSIGLFSDHS